MYTSLPSVSDMEQSRHLLDEKVEGAVEEKGKLTSKYLLVGGQNMVLRVTTFKFARITKSLRQFGYAFAPTIIRSRVFGERSSSPKLHATSWVDGLRGLGCVVVFNTHFLFAFNDLPVKSWGADAKHKSIAELPFIRWMYSSGLGIMIFFLVAGFVCSMKPLRLMRTNDSPSRDKLLQTLSLSTFKRFFRLYLPVLTSTLMIAILAYLGAYEPSRPYIGNKKYFLGVSREPQIKRYATLAGQLRFWLQEINTMMSIWEFKPFYPSHDHHLWSIREQYRGSMYLYAGLLALARTRESARLVFFVLLDCYLLWWGRWEIALFFLGALIAQVEIIRQGDRSPAGTAPDKAKDAKDVLPPPSSQADARFDWKDLKLLGNFLWLLAFILALYLMSAPRFAYKTAPGYTFLTTSIPKWYLHKETLLPSVGATLLMYCLTLCSSSSICYRVLTTNFMLYLGKISFSLYLVHGPILHIVGYMFPHMIWHFTGSSTTALYAFGLIAGWTINLGIVLWVADIYTREVDKRIVHLIDRIEGFCCVKS
jgi:peptidoglycan/LPS O-acetylase OafA/YrhL